MHETHLTGLSVACRSLRQGGNMNACMPFVKLNRVHDMLQFQWWTVQGLICASWQVLVGKDWSGLSSTACLSQH